MPETITRAACAQCEQLLPADPDEIARWKHADLVLSGDLDVAMLLCPDCQEEGRDMAYDEGGAD
jgi:hypothetical protein